MALPIAPKRSVLQRIAYDRYGRLRSLQLLCGAALLAMVVAIGTFAVLVAANAGDPATLSIWVTVVFLGVKLPVLGFLWWLLGRHVERTGEHRWDADEAREIIRRMRQATAFASEAPDMDERLVALSEEARFVAENVPEDVRPEAADLVREIEELSATR